MRFLYFLDEMWVEFKFIPLYVQIAYVFVGLVVLAILALITSSLFFEPAIFIIAMSIIGLSLAVVVITSWDGGYSGSRYEKRERRAEVEHMRMHPRPVLHKECYRCRHDSRYRAPERYLNG